MSQSLILQPAQENNPKNLCMNLNKHILYHPTGWEFHSYSSRMHLYISYLQEMGFG